ncbi:hypothetical protein D9756_002409 [Leucocoprinus leucothites]|uniref:Uncharacterized protein n=1 Tax=Leucocoprinus leucothites TaxID=201217 RepID=A0A8H5GC39_9AGAR|nr:hypothetical protein D9756_002409 [Leucoagaricus leucothites]
MDSTDSISRVSSLRTRPSFTPLGPRTPSRSTFDIPPLPSTSSSPRLPSPAYSAHASPALSPRTLPTVLETLAEPEAPQSPPVTEHLPPAYSSLPEAQVIESSSPPQSISPPPQRIPPAREMKFESQPVEWKALPLEAALWTFSSAELQQIVSRAIRSSARESFIRLLPVDNLDRVLPNELERLEESKASTQTKYRFLVHRRTMLLQALITSAQIPSVKTKDKEDNLDSITKLALQLSETTTECDRLVEELVTMSDQTSQINRMLDVHWASALAIALRKLNNSYGRRTTELQQARERITQLEAELEDAWKEAEKLAREMDEYEADMASDEEGDAVIETAEVVSVPITPTSPRPHSIAIAPTLMTVEALTPRTPLSPRHTEPIADIPADVNGQEDNQDNLSIRSGKSTKSFKSTKSARSAKSARSHRSARGDVSHSQHVSAARKRSYRASQGSLRLPNGHARKQSVSRPKTPVDEHPPVPDIPASHSRKPSASSILRPKTPMDEHPPVPDIPLQFTSPVLSAPTANASSTLLHWDSRSASPAAPTNATAGEGSDEGSPRRVPANLDDISLNDDNVIEEVPRSPNRKNMSLDDMRINRSSKPRGGMEASPTSNIPSIWRTIDTPKTPAERVESLMRRGTTNSKPTPYQKLRTLTKRYSLPFPLLSSGNKSVAVRRASDRS